MKRIFTPLIMSILILFSHQSYSQTALVAGDIAFTGYNTLENTINGPTSNDDICFILLKNITANTIINFTDFGWRSDANAFQSLDPCGTFTGSQSDGIIQWKSSTAMVYGTQVNIRCKTALSASAGTVTGIQNDAGGIFWMSLSSGGDQVFAYQGTFASPTLLAGINLNGAWDVTLLNCTVTSTQSVLPAALSTNSYAFFINPETDNGRLKTSVHPTTNAAATRAAIHNTSNWDLDDLNAFVLPNVLIFLPVKFTYLRTDKHNSFIEWGVGDELNVSHYSIESSNDGIHFQEVGTVNATGSSVYFWRGTLSENSYYRVKAVDTDGTATISTIVKVYQATPICDLFATSQSIGVHLTNWAHGRYYVRLFDVQGRLLVTQIIDHTTASGVYMVPVPGHVGHGQLLLVSIRDSQETLSQKVLF